MELSTLRVTAASEGTGCLWGSVHRRWPRRVVSVSETGATASTWSLGQTLLLLSV